MALDESPESGPTVDRKLDKDLPPLRIGSDEAQHQPRPRRKSLRIWAPTSLDHYDEKPLPPVKNSPPEPTMQPRKSNMSLFSLFSKPRFQKQRGYAEAGLAPTPPTKDESLPQTALNTPLQTPSEFSRSGSAMSFRTTATNHRSRFQESSNRSQQERAPLAWDPPPLFQAFPQSAKHGLAEISTLAPETVLAKSRAWRGRGLQVPADSDSRASTDTGDSGEPKRNARTALRHGTPTTTELQRKIFVLVTSGYLLQYAEYGPSDRLPERVLPLGDDSAAFASDLIAGRHHVLQISQAVDAQGSPVAPSGSFFSKMGMKNAAAKRTISNILLVLPNGDEMDSWLGAVRKQIDLLAGARTRADPSHEVRTRSQGAEGDAGRAGAENMSRAISPAPPPKDDELPSDEDKSKSSMEDAEAFGDRLAAGASYVRPQTLRARTPSASSSFAQSFDQQRLNSLRNSTRHSNASNGTIMTSRTNSMTSESASAKPSMEVSAGDATRGPYRNLSSYSTTSNKRRSAMPRPSSLQVQSETTSPLAVDTNVPPPASHLGGEDSPVIGRASPLPTPSPSSGHRISPLASKPSLPSLTETKSRHDSRIIPPPAISEVSERPTSVVGDLPPSTTWTPKASPAKRSPTTQPPPDRRMHRMSSAPLLRTDRPPLSRRTSSQPFQLPLKINPQSQHQQQPNPPPPTRPSPTSPQTHPSPNPPQTKPPTTTQPRPANRLSLFPSPQPEPQNLKRPLSIQIRANHTPFLASLPPNTLNPTRSPNSANAAGPSPIRSLKPSRSFAPPTPRTERPFSPNALPALDLGLPVVGLGPPAPPPSVPLPAPPPVGGIGRPMTPLASRVRSPVGEIVAPRGVSVSV